MKLKENFVKDSELYKNGFIFDVNTQTIYSDKSKTSVPPKYKDWEIEKVDFNIYSKERLLELGISDEDNLIELIGGVNLNVNERVEQRVFDTNKFGDLQILQYGLDRKPHTYNTKGGDNVTNSNREKYHLQTRLHPLHENMCGGKYDFTHAKNTPFWHKSLIELYENDTDINTLTITEGQIKSFKASFDGVPTVGLTSISHFKEKESGTIHNEISLFIRTKKIKKLIILWDGDCRDISTKALFENEDLAKRPNNFYKFASTIRGKLQDFFPANKLKIFFATIKSSDLKEQPKGIDDLLIQYKDQKSDIISDYEMIGLMPCKYFDWVNITSDTGVKKLRKYFNLEHVKGFYNFHQDKIKDQDFLYFNTTYKVENSEPIIKIDANVKNYKRIGVDYYKLIKEPIPTGKKGSVVFEETLTPWTKAAIVDDHGSKVIKHIERFEGFTNVASHVDYQEVIGNHWNLYYNLKHQVVEGEFSHIQILLKHLFEEQYTMVLDYISVLYNNPQQKLPVVCLVSKEQKTGKSTFVYLMKLIFKQNMTLISNNDLNSDFNSHWSSKLVVASEETMLEKKDAYEKIKSYSTAKTMSRNEKNKSQKDIPCMIHFIFCSNHEDDFIKIDGYDSRLWIRKVRSIAKKIKNFDDRIEEEIPAFVNFIQNREIEYKGNDRLYFEPKDFRTDAFRNIVANSEPTVIKELRENLIETFIGTEEEEIYIDVKTMRDHYRLKYQSNYIHKEVQKYFKIEPKNSSFVFTFLDHNNQPEKTKSKKGRFYTFYKKDFDKYF